MSPTLAAAQELIRRPSVTPKDEGCCQWIASRLEPLGFKSEIMPYGEVTNLWAVREGGLPGPTLVLAGHIDVVPPGPLEKWTHPPFAAEIADGQLYGRGAADMKSSVAAFVTASESFIKARGQFNGRLAFLITSDEEGPAIDGTVQVLRELAHRGEQLNYCLVGEPTSSASLGDTIKNGRRGSLSGQLTIFGKQGHVAYPHLAENPIHRFAPALAELAAIRWDDGNQYFPPTTWQVSNIQSGTGATNVIPGALTAAFNFRFATVSSPDSLKSRLEAVLDRHGLQHQIEWNLGGDPYLTPVGTLCDSLRGAIAKETGIKAELSTTGGTSDGRFIAKHCREVVEFGPVNATIHQIDERIAVEALDGLHAIYLELITDLLERKPAAIASR
ncbi:MAG: succinyl-diaminopimelate desuccinylase [Betaproteobacteria bacterium]|nr:succinyl-diaminopimelate desuccinylase [Betaproteobacteria bacterium]